MITHYMTMLRWGFLPGRQRVRKQVSTCQQLGCDVTSRDKRIFFWE